MFRKPGPRGIRRTAELDGPRACKRGFCWNSAGTGKYWRRRWHKAERALMRGYGRERNVSHYAREVNYKLT